MKSIQIFPKLTFHYLGPDIQKGPKPAFFYFALSAEDSLTKDPYNQPVLFLKDEDIRIFSVTLPEHENKKDPKTALNRWVMAFSEGRDLLTPFIGQISQGIQKLFQENILIPQKTAVGGLSRGGFIAAHVAAKIEDISTILGYAPLSFLSNHKDFHEMKHVVSPLDLIHLKEKIYNRRIRFYIGNRDKLVGTDLCFELLTQYADFAYEKGIRSAPIEMIMSPSIGHLGHGTSKEVFESGSLWIKKQIL